MKVASAFVEFLGDFRPVDKGLSELPDKAQPHATKVGSVFGSALGSAFGLVSVTAIAGLGVAALKMAGDFESATTQLVTGAGESEKNLGMIREGLLAMSKDVGVAATDLAKGMYLVESAGFHGADGLKVMKAAAEGAKVGGADMTTMADALTSAMNAYHLKGDAAVSVTNQMIAAVAAGKMHMQDFAASLSAVLPIAAANGITFAQVSGALATMTAQGVSAQQASQNLAGTIGSLANPTDVMRKEMLAMGLNSNQVAMNLGKQGLTGTLEQLVMAITAHMGPAGTVLRDTFVNSKQAASDAATMMSQLPPSIQKAAAAFRDGTITSKEWRADLKQLDPVHKALAQQFATTTIEGRSFNDLLRAGGPNAQTFSAALSNMTGGQTGLNTALLLTGGNLATFKKNSEDVAAAGKQGGDSVKGWHEVQKDFNTQFEKFKAGISSTAIEIGTNLLPAAGGFVGFLTGMLPMLRGGLDVIGKLAPLIGGVAAGWAAWNIALAVQKGFAVASAIGEVAGSLFTMARQEGIVTAAQWLFNAAMDANPIGVLVIAIAALVAGFILAYTHIKGFRDFINSAWEAVQRLWHWIFGGSPGLIPALKELAATILGMTPLGWLLDHLSNIRDVVQSLWEKFIGFVGFLKEKVGGVFEGIASAAKHVGDALQALNPFAKHSPSLVENVQMGTAIIRRHYEALGTMHITAPTLAGMSPGGIAGMRAMPALAAGATGAGGGGTTHHQEIHNHFNAPIDPRAGRRIGRDLAWEMNLRAGHR